MKNAFWTEINKYSELISQSNIFNDLWIFIKRMFPPMKQFFTDLIHIESEWFEERRVSCKSTTLCLASSKRENWQRENAGIQPFTEGIRATAITGRNVQTAIVRSQPTRKCIPLGNAIDTPPVLCDTRLEIISEMDFVFGSTPVSKNFGAFIFFFSTPSLKSLYTPVCMP